MKKIKCSICSTEIEDIQSHNAQPVNDGRCCEDCNFKVVLPKRFTLYIKEIHDAENK